MKTKLLKKIEKRIRITENKKFKIEIRDDRNTRWHLLTNAKTFGEALIHKHHYIRTFLYRDFGLKSKYLKKYKN